MGLIEVEVRDTVATVRLNAPESMNALGVPMGREFDDAMADLWGDGDVRVLIITGTGRAFSAGGDVQAFYDNRENPTAVMRETLDVLHAAVTKIIEAPFPTIAAINGVVAGAGMGVAMATDLAVAVDSAVFTMAYTGIGVSPDGSSTYYLPRYVGARRAMELILTNRILSATEALEMGLVNEVVAEDDFDDAVQALARRLARGPTLAYVHARKLLRSSFGSSPSDQMDAEAASIMAAAETRDFHEGVSAFIEKRRPDFFGA
ncbi:MAG: enoyl-CoA hydratase-related protein [Actinomycetia bacterium]|nr:enoyl-CoA hydratase-related protein [Actinomycetes bacterium]